MASEDPIDLAKVAIERVAKIALSLAVEYKRPLCGRLGAELFIVANYINAVGLDQEKRLRTQISKLLRDVESICKSPERQSSKDHGYPLLETLGCSVPGLSAYKKAEAEVRSGLARLTVHPQDTDEVILHIQRFTKGRRKSKKHESDDLASSRKSSWLERPTHVNELAHKTLREHMCCTCQVNGEEESAPKEHLAYILLQPPTKEVVSSSMVEFDMLFSSRPFWIESRLSHWQDVELLVPYVAQKSTGRRHIQFAGQQKSADPNPPSKSRPDKKSSRVDQGQFCSLIGSEANARICLSIEDGELRHYFEPLKTFFEQSPGISLAEVLDHYHLSARMKLVLAYIIAHSVWQYYDSDWMKTAWTSNTIKFMKECRGSSNEPGKLFTWKPYLAVRFNTESPEHREFHRIFGAVHHYPRIRALGVLLVEIGIGRSLSKGTETEVSAARLNKDTIQAAEYAANGHLWGDFEYPDYMNAVERCLDTKTFDASPFVAGSTHREWRDGLRKRRNILYDKIIFPLEELLQGTKWMDDLAKMPPLESRAILRAHPKPYLPEQESGSEPPNTTASKRKYNKAEKAAGDWLSKMGHFNRDVAQVLKGYGQTRPSQRVRIAILDTGYDEEAPFFYGDGVQERLKGWKDWVNSSDVPEDAHGHGTHMVSLIMKCAPAADIFVARVARSSDLLLSSSENVSKAITYACEHWKADIISMSFGFVDEQPCIRDAIRKALYQRKESILFFAAASNYGANDREMFPARLDSVISIRGTNHNGDFEDFNPPKAHNEAMAFGTLGSEVPSAWSGSYKEVFKSGTSVATAIAVGMAGSLLGYIASRPAEASFEASKNQARTKQGMEAIFRALASPTLKPGYLYITPWKLMGRSEDFRWAKLVVALADL